MAPPPAASPTVELDREPSLYLSFYPLAGGGVLIVRTTRTGDGGTISCVLDPLRLVEAFSAQPLMTGLLPPGTLGLGHLAGHPFVILRIPPQLPRPLIVARHMGSYDTTTFRLPLPPLVFAGWKDVYAVFALNTAAWPEPATVLCRPPLPNVYSDCTICWGSGERPPAAQPGAMARSWEIYIDGSHFSHHEIEHRSRRFPGNLVEHYRALEAAGAQEYPLDDPAPTSWTLASLLTGDYWRDRS